MSLTSRQRRLLGYVMGYAAEHGFSPSYREIIAGTGVSSTSEVARHLRKLQELGYVDRRSKTARSVRVIRNPS